VIRALGASAVLAARAARSLRGAHPRLFLRELLAQLHEMAVRSAWLVVSGMAFFGAVMVTIADAQARRFTGNLVVLGPAYFELLLRELGPVTSALLAAARFGARSAAELSTMSVTEQVDALRMCAGDPASDLVAPRVLAGAVGVPLLGILGTAAAALSAALTALWVFRVDGWAFLDPRHVDGADVASAGLKVLLAGLYIPLAACWHGLRARGGSAAIGTATTRAVVSACLGCLVIDVAVAVAFRLAGA
jgi:phospholipid/cholesterol/gamma-HCH transport system permease protein